jgi:hypothetical protein
VTNYPCDLHKSNKIREKTAQSWASYFVLWCTCSLFNETVTNSDYIALNNWLVPNNELERMWKEGHGLILRYYTSNCLGQLTKTTKNLHQDTQGSIWDSNWAPLDYKSELLLPEQTSYVNLYSSSNIIREIKSRMMRWAGHVTWMKEIRKVHKFSVGKHEAKDHLGDLYVDGCITLKWTLIHYWVSSLERCNQLLCAHCHTMSPRYFCHLCSYFLPSTDVTLMKSCNLYLTK